MKSLLKTVVTTSLLLTTLATTFLVTPKVTKNDLAQIQELSLNFEGEQAQAYEIPSPYMETLKLG